MRSLVLSCSMACCCSVEVPAVVARVADGDAVSVRLESGREAKVRLLYVETPESRDDNHGIATPEGKAAGAFLAELLPVRTAVILWGPGAALDEDGSERLLAVVLIPHPEDPDTPPTVVQESVIRAGWSPLWEKRGQADAKWRERLQSAQEEAEGTQAGAWSTAPAYMRDKAGEAPAP